MITLGL